MTKCDKCGSTNVKTETQYISERMVAWKQECGDCGNVVSTQDLIPLDAVPDLTTRPPLFATINPSEIQPAVIIEEIYLGDVEALEWRKWPFSEAKE